MDLNLTEMFIGIGVAVFMFATLIAIAPEIGAEQELLQIVRGLYQPKTAITLIANDFHAILRA